MKTHLLLSHLENDMHCPLCSLSGVSYDELCFHISSAHPEKQPRVQDQAHFPSTSGCSAETSTGVTVTKKPQTPESCLAGDSCDTAGEATPTHACSVTTDSVQPKQNSTIQSEGSSAGETALITSTLTTQIPKTRQKSVGHCNENSNGIKSEQSKAKQKRLSFPRKGDLALPNFILNFKFTTDLNCSVFVTEKLLSCPMCALVCSSSFILQEHVELHLQEQHSAEGNFSAF